MSIRLRVTLTSVVVAAIAVGAADIGTFTLLRRYIDDRAVTSVHEVAQTAKTAVTSGQPLSIGLFARTDRPVLVELRDASGQLLQRVGTSEAADVVLPARIRRGDDQTTQIGAQGHDGPAYEVAAVPAGGGRTIVAVVSLTAEVSTLHHLIRLNLFVGFAVLALLAIVAAILLTYSLRPLQRIATTADAIADGNLAERVPPASTRTEIGRVSTAFNRMLEEIESAFGQRDATEDRLRQFLAEASHELRTPLTSIRGYAELFRRGADRRPADLAQAMRAIESEAERMSQLVDDLLLLARLDDARPLQHAPVALDEVVEQAVDAARVVDQERQLQFELAERPLVVEGDDLRLRQVLDNLLANIRQHTPPGTSAYISLRRVGAEAVLVVEDTGPGIASDERERVFDRFFRPHDGRERTSGGAGLGLAIVRSLVVAHGGRIVVGEAFPHGAVFELRLPLVGRPAPAAAVACRDV
jgi:two-component system OmpR family sensor kinase